MFRRAYRLPFNLAGIPLYVDISFLVILPIMVWLTAGSLATFIHDPRFHLGLDPHAFTGAVPLLLGLFSVLGLFACIVLHELGHSLVARKYGVKVRRITLWFLGGVAEFEEMPRQRGAEAIVAIAGPIVSFVLGGIFWALAIAVPKTFPALWIIVWYLAIVNIMLAVFNLIPAMPLDGGRILRSLLALAMPHPRATVVAGTVAKVIAMAIGLLGLYAVAHRNLDGAWWMVLAFFIYSAAGRESEYSAIVETLRGIKVTDLMSRDIRTVPAGMTVGQLASHIIQHHHKGFPVVDDLGRLIGTVGVEQMQGVDPNRPVWQVMSTDILTTRPEATALDAFKKLSAVGPARLIVLDDQGNMTGIITRADLLRAIELRMMGLPVGQQWTPTPVVTTRAPYPFTPPPGYTAPTGYAPPPMGPVAPPPGHNGPSEHASPGQPGYTTPTDETGNSERYARPL